MLTDFSVLFSRVSNVFAPNIAVLTDLCVSRGGPLPTVMKSRSHLSASSYA